MHDGVVQSDYASDYSLTALGCAARCGGWLASVVINDVIAYGLAGVVAVRRPREASVLPMWVR